MAVATEKSQGVLSRVNLRMVIVAAVILLPVGWMVWTFATLTLSSGIEKAGQYTTVDLKSLGNFPFSEVDGTVADVPKQYAALDGKKLLLVGQMYVDTSTAPYVDRFQLVYSIQNCCFNGPPRVQERVFAHVPPGGRKVPVFGDLTRVYGTLHVRAQRENGRVVSLFDLDVEKVEEVQN
jgi:hypothetical protein